jgi:hypothetical protein
VPEPAIGVYTSGQRCIAFPQQILILMPQVLTADAYCGGMDQTCKKGGYTR